MSERTKFRVYVSKYALVLGVQAIEAEECFDFEPGMIGEIAAGHTHYHLDYYRGEGREWHRTAESALARAEEMRVEKIKSLKKQIERLKNLTFTVPE